MNARNDDAHPYLPARVALSSLRDAVQGCRACALYENATQAVFGEGLKRSRMMLVGEQPGDREDLAGRPFVGPAGGLLDRALAEAGVPRDDVYVTNAVKHFKWKPAPSGGKRRIHDKPSRSELKACEPWLRAELEVVDPDVIVCLGAIAAQALIGPRIRIGRDRGRPFGPDELRIEAPAGSLTIATLHPSAVLRASGSDQRRRLFGELIEDLRASKGLFGEHTSRG
jgi:uracil-DNA glycosylase